MKCRPHRWQYPLPGDVALVCARCGRVLPFSALVHHKYRRMRIVQATARLGGKMRGREFGRALAKALNSYFLKLERAKHDG